MPTATPSKSNRRSSRAVPSPSGHHASRILEVRALAAQLEWLASGTPHWAVDRIAWRLPDGSDLFPDASDLARAQQCVYKTRQYPLASRTVFEDPESWRTEIQRRLALAGRLRLLWASAADTGLFQDPRRLIALLPAEAQCAFGDVPGPPSQALVAIAASGRATAEDFALIVSAALDSDLPTPARNLAAMTLGAMERQRLKHKRTSHQIPPLPRSLLPPFNRGLRDGLPISPGLSAALFAHPDQSMVERGERVCRLNLEISDGVLPLPFPIPFTLLRQTLLRGGSNSGDTAKRLMEVAELLQARGSAVSGRLLCCRHVLTTGRNPNDGRRRSHLYCREEAMRLRSARLEAVRETAERFEALLTESQEQEDLAALVEQILRFAESLLAVSPASNFVVCTLRDALNHCLGLPPHLRTEFLALACEQRSVLWNFSSLAKRVQANPNGSDFGIALQNRWAQEGEKLLRFLQVTGDAELVRNSIRLGVYRDAAQHVCNERGDAEHLRILLRFVREFHLKAPDLPEGSYCPSLSIVRDILCSFPIGEEARDALKPLEQALLPAARDPDRISSVRRVLTSLLNAAPEGRAERHSALTGLADMVDPFLHWAATASDEDWDQHGSALASAAVLLAREQADEPADYFEAVVTAVIEIGSSDRERDSFRITTLGIKVALALARRDPARFSRILPLALSQTKEESNYGYQDWLSVGVAVLRRFPEILQSLALLFPCQSRRCLAVIRQIGRASHLGSEVLVPLEECHFDGGLTADTDDPEWKEIFELAPDLEALAARLWQAQWMLGLPGNVAPGIRRALQERTRRAEELSFLETLCDQNTADISPNLIIRRDNLRARLQTDGARADLTNVIRERLDNSVLEAQIAAVEQQAALCFRERLRLIAGPLPPGLKMTADLENATLLAFTITRNRKPLLKLLRRYIRASGEPNPFENQPENVAFREKLAASGAIPGIWLSAAPQSVSIAVSESGSTGTLSFHLSLETDPLHVLQMGNYFGTCLSAGSGFNAFSTVANALEQNKRVLFARDESGNVVARKLIGINEDGALVGFYTYCSLSKQDGAASLRAAIKDYLTAFAAQCRLPLADAGTVPTLFAESWYDDGVCPWAEEADDEESEKMARDASQNDCSKRGRAGSSHSRL